MHAWMIRGEKIRISDGKVVAGETGLVIEAEHPEQAEAEFLETHPCPPGYAWQLKVVA